MQLRKMKPRQIFIAVYGQSPLPVIAPRRELPCPFISRHDNNSLHPCARCLRQCILTLWLLPLISPPSVDQNRGISPSYLSAFSKRGPLAPMVKAMSLLRMASSSRPGSTAKNCIISLLSRICPSCETGTQQ